MANDNKYSRGKIYRLVNDIDDEVYIGSTCDMLAKRKAKHKSLTIKAQNRKVYSHLNQIGWDNVSIILIENYPCNSIEELKARERYWIEEMKPSLNKYIPLRTRTEYLEENKDKISQQKKEYREQNKDTILEYKKQYREQNKDTIAQQKKEWYEQNKCKLLQKMKVYREQNKDKVSTKINCQCGCKIRCDWVSRHIKSKRHQQWLQSQPSTSS